MGTEYIGLIRKDGTSDYSVDFPDFAGCVSAGKTLDEARRLGAEALQFHTEGLPEDGEDLPPPAGLEAVMRDPANAEAVAFLVPIEIPVRAAVRVNVTFAAKVLEAIDAQAEKEGASRSGLLADAALDRIRGQKFTVLRWKEGRAEKEARLSGHYEIEAARAWLEARGLRTRLRVEHHHGDWSAEELARPLAAFDVEPAAPRGTTVAEPSAGYRATRKIARRRGAKKSRRRPKR